MIDFVDQVEARLLGDSDWIAVDTLCRLCDLTLDVMTELAELGVVSPRGYSPREWQLPATALPRLRTAGRLMRDLGVNANGVALALELLEAQSRLERQLRQLERHLYGTP
jgi:chaperone modulatory protein CbpM